MVLAGKEGSIEYDFITELITAAIVVVVLFNYLGTVGTDSVFEQNFMARDLGLLIDTAYAAPGTVAIKYDTTFGDNFVPDILNFKLSSKKNISFAFDQSRVYTFRGDVIGTVRPIHYVFAHNSDFILGVSKRAALSSTERGTGDNYLAPEEQGIVQIKKSAKELNITFTGDINE
ncbi:MAG TPA: hypothetical protein VKE88_03280 [Candidatus Nanoarchaeia archaeon]|nr:hypothetical protein [Candidatus Nanoarchaeia archaeon]